MRRAIKSILGFTPGNIFLYRLAFRHRSVSMVTNGYRRNNERLEFLGDAVLDLVIADYLFKKYPTRDEGFLTEMRSKIVSRASLNKVSQHMGLHKLIQLDKASHNHGGFKSVDGDALEALVGAIFLDKGFLFAKKIILERIVGMHMDVDNIEQKDWNYKSKLIDWCQRERKKADFRVDPTKQREAGKRLYKVEVRVDGELWATALEHSIKSAEQLAAENAYKKMVDPWLEAHAYKHAGLPENMEAEKQRIEHLRLQKIQKRKEAAKAAEEKAVEVSAAATVVEVEAETPAPVAEVAVPMVEAATTSASMAEPMAESAPAVEFASTPAREMKPEAEIKTALELAFAPVETFAPVEIEPTVIAEPTPVAELAAQEEPAQEPAVLEMETPISTELAFPEEVEETEAEA